MRIGKSGRIALAVAAVAAAAGCSINTHFVYKPGPPEAGGVKLPVKVAVLPLTDATEDFGQRGTIWKPEELTFNVVKATCPSTMDALPPEFWSKALAEDLQASGIFRSVRFAYAPQELADEQYVIDGAVERAYIAGAWKNPSDFAIRLRLSARPGGRVVGEQTFAKTWVQGDPFKPCGMSPSCQVERFHKQVNDVFREMFAQARAWLAGAVSSAPVEGAAAQPAGVAPAPAPGAGGPAVFSGIGLRVGARDGSIVVQGVIEGAPAARAGLQQGDTIVAVDGVPAAGLSVEEFVRKTRGVPGTSVTLAVSRPGWPSPREFRLTREEIAVSSPAAREPASVEETIERILKEK